jgi:hypothetical protein
MCRNLIKIMERKHFQTAYLEIFSQERLILSENPGEGGRGQRRLNSGLKKERVNQGLLDHFE